MAVVVGKKKRAVKELMKRLQDPSQPSVLDLQFTQKSSLLVEVKLVVIISLNQQKHRLEKCQLLMTLKNSFCSTTRQSQSVQ